MALNIIKNEISHSANIYKPLQVLITSGKGIYVLDYNNNKYIDFLSGYSAANLGHSHPKIIQSAKLQLDKITILSRSFYNDKTAEWTKFICNYFNYDKVIAMNTGAEAVETAIKIARRWGYKYKGDSKIIAFNNNFHGRTIGVLSASSNNSYKQGFGPFCDNFLLAPYNDVKSVELLLENRKDICAILIEPIQGEGGVIIPDDTYLYDLYNLCKKYNVLFIADEIQSGLGRTGSLLCCDIFNIKPDILILGKSLGGGIVPISAVLTSNDIMNVLDYGAHGSTFGGNPFACAISIDVLNIINDEKIVENSFVMGNIFRNGISNIDIIKKVRGKGLFNAIEFDEKILNKKNITTFDICNKLMENGLLAKNTNHNSVIRFTPPLIIKESEMLDGLNIINKTIQLL
jgi:ornithine--oxo-acid transaminase